jgi:Protein kinase domain
MPRGKLSCGLGAFKEILKKSTTHSQSDSVGSEQQPFKPKGDSRPIPASLPNVPAKKQSNPSPSNPSKDPDSDPSGPLPTTRRSAPDRRHRSHASLDPRPYGSSFTDTLQRTATMPKSSVSTDNPHLINTGQGQVSPRVDCHIIPVYNGKELPEPHECKVDWMGSNYFRRVDDTALQLLRDSHNVPETTQLYRKSGRCRLINDKTHQVDDSRIVETRRQWAEAIPQMVMAHLYKNTYDAFHLEIRLEYSALSISAVKGERYATTVQNVVHEKLVTNWEDEKYIPRRDLEQIYSESTIKNLIDADQSLARLSLTADQRAEFLEKININATRLLAICIHIDMPLACLYHLLEKDYKDEDLPLSRKKHHCPGREYEVKFESFMKWQGAFVAHIFVNDEGGPKHISLPDDVILPIIYDKERPSLGKGGFGEVYKIYIHSDHHYFSSYRNAPLALKRFFQYPRTREDFGKEEKVLMALAEFPHSHITPHLASWTQRGIFYVLFPCAEMNLHEFLRLYPPRDLDTDFVKWLLQQLRGLADGVRHIHNLGPSRLAPEPQSLLPPDFRAQRSRSGYHHDIKPKNILVFAKDKVGGGDTKVTDFIFKISDFGAAKINIILSKSGEISYQTEALSAGDPAYRAPDYELDGVTSRPYDIWSLGCVFLEVLVWTFDLRGNELVSTFASERLHASGSRDMVGQSSAFWHRNQKDKIVLKSSVIKHLQQLRTHGEKQIIFKHFVRNIGKMLIIPPIERATAAEVYNVLDAAYMQADYDVRKQPDIYQQDMNGYQQVAASPTTVHDEGSRRPSIDQRSFQSFHTHDNEKPRTHESGPRSPSSSNNRFRKERTSLERGLSTTGSDPLQLSPLDTQNLPPRHNHSPSPSIISVSHHDDPHATEQRIFDAAHNELQEPFPPVGSHSDPFGREDFIPLTSLGRRRTGDSQSI